MPIFILGASFCRRVINGTIKWLARLHIASAMTSPTWVGVLVEFPAHWQFIGLIKCKLCGILGVLHKRLRIRGQHSIHQGHLTITCDKEATDSVGIQCKRPGLSTLEQPEHGQSGKSLRYLKVSMTLH